MASFPATETNLISPLLWSKDFVQRAGRALSPKALKSGKRNARPATSLRFGLLRFMPTWETKIRPSGGSTPLIRSAIRQLVNLKTDFLLDPLRSDPRFAELVRKVGLPQ